MSNISLFPLRRVIIISLLLGFLTMGVVGDALGTDEKPTSEVLTSTTTTTTTTSTSSRASNETSTVTQNITGSTSGEEEISGNQFDVGKTEKKISEDDSKGGMDLGSLVNKFTNAILFSLSSLFASVVFSVLIVSFYFLVFNNSELRNYLNQSLVQAGFKPDISAFGKKWELKNNGDTFSMSLMGFKNLRMKIELPKHENVDPREFGLRNLSANALTFCDLEVLALRLNVIKMYFAELDRISDLK